MRANRAYAFSLFGRVSRAGGRVLAFLCVSRLYSVDDVGQFAYLLAVGTFTGILTDLGLTEYLVREIPAAGDHGRSLERRALALRAILLVPALPLAWLAVRLTEGRLGLAAMGTLAYGIAVGASDTLAAVRRARGQYDLEGVESGLPPLGALAAGAVAGGLGASYDVFQGVLGLSAAGLFFLRWYKLAPRGVAGPGASLSARPIIWASRWFLVKALLAWALADATVVLIQHLGNASSVALYASAMRPVGFLSQPLAVLQWVFMPSLVHDRIAGPARFVESTRTLNLISLCLLPALLGGAILGGKVLLFGFGSAYLAAEPIVAILAVAYGLYGTVAVAAPLVVAGKERFVSFSMAVGLLATAAGCVLLVPRLGAFGAALATMAGLVCAKGLQVASYAAAGISLGDRRHLAAAAATAAWLGITAVVPDEAGMVILGAGALSSGVIGLRMLARTGIRTSSPSATG